MTDADVSMPVDSERAEPLPQPARHPSLYFEDGDLVISATQQDDAPVLFRVHAAILGRFSPVFRDMMSFPEGVTGRELYDGVPIVHLSDDAKDVADFFEALYNPGCVHYSTLTHVQRR